MKLNLLLIYFVLIHKTYSGPIPITNDGNWLKEVSKATETTIKGLSYVNAGIDAASKVVKNGNKLFTECKKIAAENALESFSSMFITIPIICLLSAYSISITGYMTKTNNRINIKTSRAVGINNETDDIVLFDAQRKREETSTRLEESTFLFNSKPVMTTYETSSTQTTYAKPSTFNKTHFTKKKDNYTKFELEAIATYLHLEIKPNDTAGDIYKTISIANKFSS